MCACCKYYFNQCLSLNFSNVSKQLPEIQSLFFHKILNLTANILNCVGKSITEWGGILLHIDGNEEIQATSVHCVRHTHGHLLLYLLNAGNMGNWQLPNPLSKKHSKGVITHTTNIADTIGVCFQTHYHWNWSWYCWHFNEWGRGALAFHVVHCVWKWKLTEIIKST